VKEIEVKGSELWIWIVNNLKGDRISEKEEEEVK
jgi:hypothetical protein